MMRWTKARMKMACLYEESFKSVRAQSRQAIQIRQDLASVDVGYKSEGIILIDE
jgi:hypothetical protein